MLIVAVFATLMIMGSSISSINNVLAKQKYSNLDDCRDKNSQKWCKNYFKFYNEQDYGNGNKASQGTGQSQSSSQNSKAVLAGNAVGSGNSINVQNQVNTDNNALTQR